MPDTDILQQGEQSRAILVELSLGRSEEEYSTSLQELERLLETAGGEVAAIVIQNHDRPDNATYIGSGKCQEIAELIQADPSITMVIFDNELSPAQIANVEEHVNVRVIDRTMLILDIFALHAVTAEGKLQVEIACLRYTAPRLIGKGTALSRQGGGIGSRGPGESKLETDRRHIRQRIDALQAELDDLEKVRATKRSQRRKSKIPTAAIIGYTNAGKSTLLNHLTNAGILAEDKLFATLDPTTRKLTLPSGTEMLLTDTVGFIDHLPTQLVRAFRSTLEELVYSDFIICLTDASEEASERTRKRNVTRQLMEELGAGDKTILEVYNKVDLLPMEDRMMLPGNAIEISAQTGFGIDALLAKLDETVNESKKTLTLLFPHSDAGKVSDVYRLATVLEISYTDEGTLIQAQCDQRAQAVFAPWVVTS